MGRRDVAASAGLESHIRSAAIAAARVDDAVVKHRGRNRKPVRLADVPQQRAGSRIVRVETLAGVDDQLRAERALDDERCAVGGTPLPAIRFPALLAGGLVEADQVRARRLIAQQNQQVVEEHGRAGMSPLNVEGADLLAQVALPDHRALPIEREQLTGAEPREHQRAVGDGARRGEVVLVVNRRERPLRFRPMLPAPCAIASSERLDHEHGFRRIGRAPGVERPLTLRRRVSALDEPGMVARPPHAGADLRRHEDQIAAHDRRGDARSRDWRLPRDLLCSAPPRREDVIRRHAARTGAPPVRPVGRAQRDAREPEPRQDRWNRTHARHYFTVPALIR